MALTESVNHGEDELVLLIKIFDSLCDLIPVLQEIEVDLTRYNCYFIDTEEFVKHKGHNIGVKSEYGYLLDDCNKEYRCDACGAIERCRRKKEHDGPCNKIRDYKPGNK